MTTWRKLITEAMVPDDSWENVVSCTLSDEELDVEFDDGYGGTRGVPFTLWTKKNVYFPIQYDGSEWVGSVSRKPDGKPTYHMGGG
jgi:hypothetical protein